MPRLRTTYQDDWEDLALTNALRIRLLGLSLHPFAAMGGMLCCVVVLVTLVAVSQASWFPDGPVVQWTVVGISLVGMCVVATLAVILTWTMARALHRSRQHLARLDGATDEEARQESDRYLVRNLFLRLALYAVVIVGIWVLLGSPWVFPWGGLLPYAGALVALVAVFTLYMIFRERMVTTLRRLVGRG